MQDVKVDHIALVNNPFQKYSVCFPSGATPSERGDRYDYAVLEYLMDRLKSPWHAWDVKNTTKWYPRSAFEEMEPGDFCPCNSGKNFGECCQSLPGVTLPHYHFTFAVSPSRDLMDGGDRLSTTLRKSEKA
ncbi:MAG: SEC-C domain-containing protein [bacterium]|nr:SEC-C domain-containing protein [bacterium]